MQSVSRMPVDVIIEMSQRNYIEFVRDELADDWLTEVENRMGV